MKTHEPKCVALKRQGAEYVAQMLSGKSRQEELEFWSKRTEHLRSSHNKANTLGQPKAAPLVPRSASFGCR